MSPNLAVALVTAALLFALPSTATADSLPPYPIPDSQSQSGSDAILATQTERDSTLLAYLGRAEAAANEEVARNNWRYFWSALAQSLAAIATLVFTVTLVMSQLRARYGMEAAKSVLNRGNTARFLLLLAAMALSLLGIHWSVFHNPVPATIVILGSIAVLVWHSSDMPRSLSMQLTVDRLGKRVRSGVWTEGRTVEMLRQLETIAHGALAQSDFDVLHAATAELAKTVAHAEHQSRTASDEMSGPSKEESEEALSYLQKLLLEAAKSPKAISHWPPTRSPPWLAGSMIDTFDFALRTCAWPRQEESYTAIFEVMGLMLEGLACSKGEQSKIVGDLIDRCTALLPDWGTPAGEQTGMGSGHAAYTLLLASLRATKAKDGQHGVADVCMQKALELASGTSGRERLQRFYGWAVSRISEAIRQNWMRLDEKNVQEHLEKLDLSVRLDREPLLDTYIELLGLALCEGKFYIAAACLHVLNELSARPWRELDTVALAMGAVAKGENAKRLASEAASKTPIYTKLDRLLDAISNHWQGTEPRTSDLVDNLLSLAKAFAPTVGLREDSFITALWDTAKALQNRIVNNEELADDAKQEATYVALSLGCLSHLHWGQFDRPKYEEMREGLRRDAGTYSRFNPFKAADRAKTDFPHYACTLEGYYRGTI